MGGGGEGEGLHPVLTLPVFFLVSAIDSQIPIVSKIGTRAHAVHPRRMSLKKTRIRLKMAAALSGLSL